MEKFKTWLDNSWWSWGNCINYRFVAYKDNIDRCAFFEEINCGWYQMYIYPYDDWYNPTISAERKLLLAEHPKVIYLSVRDFDALVEAIENPPAPSQALIDLLNRTPPWENTDV
jgi:hypothetical protein